MQQETPSANGSKEGRVMEAIHESKPVTRATIEDFGVGYFNPLIGDTPTETCGNISDVMQTLYEVFKGEEIDLHGAKQALLLIMQTVWSAAQYTSNSNQEGAA